MIDRAALDVLLAAVLEDPASAPVCADWLVEHEAGLPEVLVLYAGQSPHHTDGLPHCVLAEWCAAMRSVWGDGGTVGRKVAEYVIDAEWVACRVAGLPEVDRFVAGFSGTGLALDVLENINPHTGHLILRVIVQGVEGYPGGYRAGPDLMGCDAKLQQISEAAERARRRRTLELFPEVVCLTLDMPAPIDAPDEATAASFLLPWRDIALDPNGNGVRDWGLRPGRCDLAYRRDEDGRWRAVQTVRAPHLIPPEASPRPSWDYPIPGRRPAARSTPSRVSTLTGQGGPVLGSPAGLVRLDPP